MCVGIVGTRMSIAHSLWYRWLGYGRGHVPTSRCHTWATTFRAYTPSHHHSTLSRLQRCYERLKKIPG